MMQNSKTSAEQNCKILQNSKTSAEQQNFTEQNLNFTEQWASMD